MTTNVPSERPGGTLDTAHGRLHLPAFLPDATRGVVRAVDSADAVACGVQGLVVNTFHLQTHPGVSVISALGGVHAFMNWHRPVLADSGGFQIFSLLTGSRPLGSITREGFAYRVAPGSRKRILTAEKCIRQQFRMGADIMVCLDHCTHPDAPQDEQRHSVENTVRWAKACRQEFDRRAQRAGRKPLLFAVIQGGSDPALRRECAEQLLEVGFDGYGYGGWPVTEDGRLVEMVGHVAELIPARYPRWALGIGKPENVVKAAAMGYDLFDCVIPTRDARHGRLYAFTAPPERGALKGRDFYECVYMRDREHVRADGPVDPHCDCLCCRSYSRAYVHHLFRIRDLLACRLATIHNLRFYSRLMECLRSRRAAL